MKLTAFLSLLTVIESVIFSVMFFMMFIDNNTNLYMTLLVCTAIALIITIVLQIRKIQDVTKEFSMES